MFSVRDRRYILTVTLLILQFFGYSLTCGPTSSRLSATRKPKRTVPFVYKEHEPKISEFTLGASGQPEGAIHRGDPRFKDLVENHNTDIIFRDEERDGSDRIMSRVGHVISALFLVVLSFLSFSFFQYFFLCFFFFLVRKLKCKKVSPCFV